MISMATDPRRQTLTQETLTDEYYFWMGGDDLLVPGVLALSELRAAIGVGDHTHNDLYAPIDHTHDDDYAALAHTHHDLYYTETEVDDLLAGVGGGTLSVAYCAWIGDATGDGNRDIYYTPAIVPKVIWMTRNDGTLQNGLFALWNPQNTVQASFLMKDYGGIFPNAFYETPTSGKLPLYRNSLNYMSYSYQAIILGEAS